MPLVSFADLPNSARIWVFGSASPLAPAAESALLSAVDTFLHSWKAHGAPLTVARDWRDHRFLAIAVDTAQEAASGCSIDGLFRELKRIDTEHGSSFIGGGRIFLRDADRNIICIDRNDADDAIATGVLTRETPVFDFTVPTLGDWRTRFETIAEKSWHGTLLSASVER